MASTAVATRPAAPPPAKAGAGARALPTVRPQAHKWGPVTMATAVVVAGETLLFATLVAAWLLCRSASPSWVPEDTQIDLYRGSTIVATILLAALMAQWAVTAARRDDGANTIIATAFSVGLGAAGAVLAWFTMVSLDLGVGSSLYVTLWYALLGTFIAVAVLTCAAQLATLGWALSGHYSADDHQPMTAVALQWWLLLAVAAAYWLAIWVLR
jgi:heme/copper-type cytochrome/quinol oxidase subunit 3